MARLKGLTVLLVEDDPDNRELISICLEGEGASTLTADSVAGAIALSVGQRIDVIVSDFELADGDGCALLQRLSVGAGDRRPPAIAVTGYSQEQWRSRAADCGFARYAVKPFPLERLVTWIAELSGGAPSSDPTAQF